MKDLRLLIASPEMVPLSKTGGLADVAGALPKALSELGIEVRIITPKYSSDIYGKLPVKPFYDNVAISSRLISPVGTIEEVELDNRYRTFVVTNDAYYNRRQLYGTASGDYSDNLERFTFFSGAVFDFIRRSQWYPHIIHCHDWQTGLIPAYIRTLYSQDNLMKSIGSVFTIHNLAYQGTFSNDQYPVTNLPWEEYVPDKIEYYGDFSLIKAGMVYADSLTTVSENYSREIQTPEFGCGMDGVLRMRRKSLYGIINGIDYEEWNPESDTHIPVQYTVNDISGKRTAKQALQRRTGLPVSTDNNTPLIGMISRLADQKGLDLLATQIDAIMRMDVQLVVLGTGDEKYHELLSAMAKRYPSKFSVNLFFDDALARLIYAGSDFFFMPSRFEPCGLGQLIAMKYGSIPIAHKIGGLADTIQSYDTGSKTGNGFLFAQYTPAAMLDTLQKSIEMYHLTNHRNRLIENCMQCDYSWKASAKRYLQLFEDIARSKKAIK